MKNKKMHVLPERVYIPKIAARWGVDSCDVISLLMGQCVVFTMLEEAERLIIFQDIIWETIKEKAREKGVEPQAPKPEREMFVRIPVLEEYLEIIMKYGYWKGVAIVHDFVGDDREELFESAVVSSQDKGKDIKIVPEDLYVSSTDLLNFEKKYGLGPVQEPSASRIGMSFMNADHTFHAKELKIAVEAWLELYEKNPPNGAPKGGHKKYIEEWLSNYQPKLGVNALKRIATIINPNPKGGASSSGID